MLDGGLEVVVPNGSPVLVLPEEGMVEHAVWPAIVRVFLVGEDIGGPLAIFCVHEGYPLGQVWTVDGHLHPTVVAGEVPQYFILSFVYGRRVADDGN